jgi:hypothetical protein
LAAVIFVDLALVLDSEKVQNADAFPTATRINAGLPSPARGRGRVPGWRRRHLTMSTSPVSEPPEQPGWIELGWADEHDAQRPPILGPALLAALAAVTGVALALAIWVLATGQIA